MRIRTLLTERSQSRLNGQLTCICSQLKKNKDVYVRFCLTENRGMAISQRFQRKGMTFRTYSGHHEHLSGNDVDEMAGFLFLFGTDTNAHDDSNGDKLYPGHAKWIAGRRLKGYR